MTQPTLAALAAAAFVACGTAVTAAPARDAGDERELAVLRAESPHAADLLDRGEVLFASGAVAEADALFRQGHDEYPEGSLLWRRDCEARTVLGQRSEAVVACSEAIERRRSDLADRAMASAFLDGPNPPSSGDLYQAWLVTERARKNPHGAVTVAATTCDLAERIGDGPMLQRCGRELERIAPEDPATRRAMAALSAQSHPWRFWGAWGALFAVIAITLVGALRRAIPRVTKRSGAAAAAVLVSLVLLSVPSTVRAADGPSASKSLSKWPIDLEHPERGIPSEKDRNADPLQFGYWLQDVVAKAEHASKDGDHLTAAKLYAALGVAVPDRAVSFVKLCAEYEALGDLAKAANACGDALLRDGVRVVNYSRFVQFMLTKPGELGDKDIAALGAVLQHVKEDPAGREVAADLECQVGTRTVNVPQLEECTSELAARAPDDAKTISYLWALAVAERRFDDARKLGERAQAAGIPAESVAAMNRTTASSEARRRWAIVLYVLGGGAFLALVGLLGRSLFRRRPTLAANPTECT